jgi:hypothetical protein
MEGKVVNGRAVWQKQGEDKELFLFCAKTIEVTNNSCWFVGTRENMDKGKNSGYMFLATAALTPDQACPSDVCKVFDGRKGVEAAEARFVISHDYL